MLQPRQTVIKKKFKIWT